MKAKEILLCILCGILISAAATGFHYSRGRYIVVDRCSYLYPGATYVENVGMIDPVKAEKWIRVRYQIISAENGTLRLRPDWDGIRSGFYILCFWYSVLSIFVYLVLTRNNLFRKK